MVSQLNYSMDIIPEAMPILVLLNKQDLHEKDPISISQALVLFVNSDIRGRNIDFIETSAKYGDGMEAVIKWVKNSVDFNY